MKPTKMKTKSQVKGQSQGVDGITQWWQNQIFGTDMLKRTANEMNNYHISHQSLKGINGKHQATRTSVPSIRTNSYFTSTSWLKFNLMRIMNATMNHRVNNMNPEMHKKNKKVIFTCICQHMCTQAAWTKRLN